MFGFRKFFGKGKGGCGREHRHEHGRRHMHRTTISLNEALPHHRYIIVNNPDRKTMEMGVYIGGIVNVQKNEACDPNIVVAVGESRFIIPREIAQKIIIR